MGRSYYESGVTPYFGPGSVRQRTGSVGRSDQRRLRPGPERERTEDWLDLGRGLITLSWARSSSWLGSSRGYPPNTIGVDRTLQLPAQHDVVIVG